MTTYTNWMVGDLLNLCAAVEDLCISSPGIYLDEINVTKSPNPCTIGYNTPGGCGLHINNIGVTFKLVKTSTSAQCNIGNPVIVYKTIGTAYSDSNGVCSLQYTVTDQDRIDYNSSGGSYQLFATISNPDGQLTSTTNICSNYITVAAPPEKWRCSDAVTNACIRDDINGTYDSETVCKAASSCQPPSGATDYIEYDFSFLPTSFLDLVSSNMVSISNGIGGYLPMSSNAQYISSEYNNGKFRIYVMYTPPTLSTSPPTLSTSPKLSGSTLSGLSEFYTSPDKIPDLLANLSIISLITLPLIDIARILSGILIFAICQQILVEVVGWGTIISAIVGAVGAVAVDFVTHNINLDTSIKGKANIPPDQQILSIRDFANNVRIRCGILYPGCNSVPPTCDVTNMKGYNKCVGAVDIEQYINDGKQTGTPDQAGIDDIITRVNGTDVCLTDGTCTVPKAQSDINKRISDVIAHSEQKQADATCDTGFVYNSDTKKCVPTENCVIRNPFGGCILSQDTVQNILLLGGLLVGGYVTITYGSGQGSTEHVVTIRQQIEQAKEKLK